MSVRVFVHLVLIISGEKNLLCYFGRNFEAENVGVWFVSCHFGAILGFLKPEVTIFGRAGGGA